jgi:hypothetical protein
MFRSEIGKILRIESFKAIAKKLNNSFKINSGMLVFLSSAPLREKIQNEFLCIFRKVN